MYFSLPQLFALFEVFSVAVFVIRDRFVKKADLCLNLDPCVIKYSLSLSFALFDSLSVSLPLSVAFSLCLWLCLSVCVSLSVSVSLSLSLSLSHTHTHTHTHTQSRYRSVQDAGHPLCLYTIFYPDCHFDFQFYSFRRGRDL